jgi:hypothetical protein
MLLNFIPKPLDVLRRSITQRLSKIPPCPLAQLALTALGLTKRKLTLALNSLLNILHAHIHQRPRRRARLDEAGGKHVPPRRARRHLELEIPRSVDELQHRVRRIVPRAVSELVYARVAARTVCVARREGFEEFGREGGLEEERGGFLPGRVRALFP